MRTKFFNLIFGVFMTITGTHIFANSPVGEPLSPSFNLPSPKVKENNDEILNGIRLLSYNVRVDHEQDTKNENNWIYRREKVVYVLQRYQGDILALQEPNEKQLADLQKALGQNFSWVHARASDQAYRAEALLDASKRSWADIDAIAEKDATPEEAFLKKFRSEQHRETQAIAYDNTRFELLDSGKFWLAPDSSKEPEEKAWDGSPFARVAVYARLYDRVNEKAITIFTTHFDHAGLQARKESARLMVAKAKELSRETPFFITGDMNTFENSRGFEVYDQFLKYKSFISDVRGMTNVQYGPTSTWVGWENNGFNEKKMRELCPGQHSRWDHVFLSNEGINVYRTAVGDDQFKILWADKEKVVYPSDHRPIIVDFNLED